MSDPDKCRVSRLSWLALFPLEIPFEDRLDLVESGDLTPSRAGWEKDAPIPSVAVVRLAREGQLTEAINRLEQVFQDRAGRLADDPARILYATLLLIQGQAHQAADVLLHLEPYVDNRLELRLAVTVLLGHALLDLGNADNAWSTLTRADGLLRRSPDSVWRAVTACLRAELLHRSGQHALALRHLQQAARLKRQPDAGRFILQARLAELHPDPFERRRHALLADRDRPPFLTPFKASRAAWTPADLPTGLPAVPCRRVHLQLLRGASIQVDGVRIDCIHAPRLPLLLSYVLQYPGQTLEEIAERLLPEDTGGRVVHADQHHRVARIRRDISRCRTLLGDPQVVLVRQGVVDLHPEYDWSSDLLDHMSAGRQVTGGLALPSGVECDWVSLIRSGAAR